MTQRVRNIQIALGSNMPSSDAVAIQEAYGFNMGAYKKATQTVSASTTPVISSITALATPVNGGTTNAYTYVEIFGTVDVANQGVLQLQWAQQAASGSTAFLVGSKIQAFQITGP
jgi:hypothetical protein